MQFGHQFKTQFEFEEGYICVNQCSYGQCPKRVSDLKRYWLNRFIGNPDKFVKYDYLPLAKKNKQVISEFLGANDEQTFFTQNATEAYNGIIKSLDFKQGDQILYNNVNFPMIKALLTHQQEYVGIEMIQIQFTVQDLKNDVIIAKYKQQFQSNKNIKVAIFDFISSMPSLVFPVKQLIALCKEYNIISLIDGAHGAGIAEINLSELDPDFFFTNLHKWCFTPCPASLLYMNKRFINKIHTSTISMNYGLGTEKEFEYNGTLDRTNFLCISEGVSFIKEIGLQNIIKHSYELAWQGACVIAKIWGTKLMFKEEDKNMQSAMVMIEVPHNDWEYTSQCQQKCSEDFNVLVVLVQFNEKIWTRVSASIYNELSDYEYAANSFLQCLKTII